MPVAVRLGGDPDIPQALGVFAEADAARRGCPVEQGQLDSVAHRLRHGGAWLLLAETDGKALGIAAGFDAREDDGAGAVIPGLVHLSLVFVRPAHWGRGLGGRLVDAALAEAERRGHAQIQLWTHEDNVRGQRLYASRGFVRQGRRKEDDRGEPIALWVRNV
jgi:GNAT superfamily N-acetyltransferase